MLYPRFVEKEVDRYGRDYYKYIRYKQTSQLVCKNKQLAVEEAEIYLGYGNFWFSIKCGCFFALYTAAIEYQQKS